jgi:hypothetical protein
MPPKAWHHAVWRRHFEAEAAKTVANGIAGDPAISKPIVMQKRRLRLLDRRRQHRRP